MDAQQPQHQHLAPMTVDLDGQQQQQQQQQQLPQANPHFAMPAPVEHGPPMASGFAAHSPPMHASPYASSSMYGQHQGHIAQPSMFQGNTSATMGMPMGLNPRYQLTPSYMGYTPQSAHAGPIQPFIPPAPTSVSMPPGMPPLLMSRPTLQWIVLSDDMAPLDAARTDASFAEANGTPRAALQERLYDHFRRWQGSEGGGTPAELQQEIERLKKENELLCRESEDRGREIDDLEARVNEAWEASEHHEDRARRLEDELRRHRHSRSLSPGPRRRDRSPPPRPAPPRPPPHQQLPNRPSPLPYGDRYYAPPRGEPLRPGPSGMSRSTSQAVPSNLLGNTTSLSSPAPPFPSSDFPQGSSSTSQCLGPEAAFDSNMEDDDVDSESEGYNVKKGKQRAFNNANRAVLCRTRERLISQVTGTTPRQPAPPPPAPTLPALGPSAGLDPPRVPGGVRQPHMSVWPEATPVQAADAWSDYVPLNHHQYWELVRSARAQGGGAYNRVRDLLHQYDANGALGAFNYLHQLKMSWSDPHRAETRSQARRARDFGREAVHSNPSRIERNPGMQNPSRTDPPERWLEYWHQYPDTLLVYLPIPSQLGRPTRDHTRGHILLRALIPKLKGAQQSAERARFLEVTAQLFSIPGLYQRIVDEGHYPEGTVERLLPYPGQVTNVSIFDLAAWYAHCGLSAASIALMQPMAVRMRQYYERRDPNSAEAFLQWPRTMAEVAAVPVLAELALQVAALQENPDATTGHATVPLPLVIEGVDVDETMGEAQGIGEDQADEPGPSGTVLSTDAPGPSPPSA
ncbi:hypothetical protein DICSQDRAFT_174074 [Dichomitus squalens LYAD-421 SS1]|uniref:Uncharacterized protein n=1 Tax=Dichomitus squalens (strain LYAD-421) TaxID=732165 RepID=R7SNL6_DICSQ|nr:uncharacterized protein DICSQDRAFT_174074 [Dichomitus squalens LYAD-421 SS1]EJF57315.1 hypothetical protein DICSQDRAFT_174074 [Dichomitus squalens LYAD-421 SS1]